MGFVTNRMVGVCIYRLFRFVLVIGMMRSDTLDTHDAGRTEQFIINNSAIVSFYGRLTREHFRFNYFGLEDA